MNEAAARPIPDAFSQLSAVSLANILDQSVDCIKLISLDGTIEYMNQNGLCAMEMDDFCAIEGTRWADMWPAATQALIEAAYADAAVGKTVLFRAPCPTAKGAPRWWDVSLSRVTDDAGQLAGYLSISRDVTANQASREALEIGAAELKHRLRNTYQMIASLLVIMARGNPENEKFSRQMAARIGALSRAQLLFSDHDAPCDLDILVPALVSPFESSSGIVSYGALSRLAIAQPQADAIALVVGELAVNSSKHGALAHGGTITVGAVHEGDAVTIEWREQCTQRVHQHARDGGQGMILMDQIMRTRGGTFMVEWHDFGLTATVSFTLDGPG